MVGDPRLVAAFVDRPTFNAHIIETGTESFRLRSTGAKRIKWKSFRFSGSAGGSR